MDNDTGTMKKGWKLKATFNKKENEIWIRGNSEGLEFLSNCCLSIINKKDPSGHIHLEWQMGNLLEDSVAIRLEFSDDNKDYK